MRLTSFFVAAAMLASSLAAHADTFITYDVTGAFPTGTINGTITWDQSTNTYSADVNAMFNGYSTVFTVAPEPVFFFNVISFLTLYDSSALSQETSLFLVEFGQLQSLSVGPLCSIDYRCDLAANTPEYTGIQLDQPPVSEDLISGSITLAQTPEPSSIALLGTGMLGIAGVLRKRFA